MTAHRDSGAARESASAGSEVLVEAQQWLARHGVVAPEPDPVRDPARPQPSGGGQGRSGGQGRESRSRGRAGGARKAGAGGGPANSEVADDPESVARTIVFRKLAAQARTRHELDQALRAKEVPDPVAAQVLDRMEEIGLVDDAGFARDWVDSRQQRRQLSRRALRQELERKGVGRDEIDDALEAVDSEDEYDAARVLAERKVRTVQGLAREVQYRRLAGVLGRRGFNGSLTARVIAEVLAADEV